MATLNFGTTINLGTIANTLCINNTTTSYSFSELRSFSSTISTSGALSMSSLSNTNIALFKFPPSALSINAMYSTTGTTITNAREGSGAYFTNDSTELSATTGAYNAFDGVFNNTSANFYASASTFEPVAGLYTGGNSLSGFSGEWLTLQSPNKFVLKKYRVYPTNLTSNAPGVWRVYGSNDESDWTLLHNQSSRVTGGWTLGSFNEYSIDSNTHGSYRYYGLVTNQLSGNTGGSVRIAEIEYYGPALNNVPLHNVDWTQITAVSTAGSTSFSVLQSGSAPNVQYQLSQNTTGNTEVSVINPTSGSSVLQIPNRLQEYKSFTASFEILATNATSHSINFFVGSSSVPTLTTGNALITRSGYAVNFDIASSKISLYDDTSATVGTQITDSTWKNNVWYPVSVKYQNSTSGTWEINANNQIISYSNPTNSVWVGNTTSSYFWGVQTLTTSTSADSYVRRLQIKTSGERCFLSPGTYNFIVPSNVTQMSAVCIGGGGGGGCGAGNSINTAYGAGGGGVLTYATFSVTPDEVLSLVVGAGGAAGTASSRTGGNGGDSYVLRGSSTKEPSVALTSNTGGTYIASASTETTAAFTGFDGDRGGRNYWSSAATYNATTGNYAGSVSTTAGSTVYSGEWLQIQLPSAITLSNFVIFPRGDTFNSFTFVQTSTPTSFVILGSNDGSTWSLVHQESGLTITRPRQYTVTTSPPSYSYYRLVAQVLGNAAVGGNKSTAMIGEWELNVRYHSLAKGGYGGESNRAGLGALIVSSISDGNAGSGGNGFYNAASGGGGGGAGGYSGNGGAGNNATGVSGTGGGAGGGGRPGTAAGSGGGGTGIFGSGATGAGSATGGITGSGGTNGTNAIANTHGGDGGLFGGGGGTPDDAAGVATRGGVGGGGAIRLYW